MKLPTHYSLVVKGLACALFTSLATITIAYAGSDSSTVSSERMEWRTDLDAALADAAKSNKSILLRFTAKWCGPCRVMDAKVWPDPAVQVELSEQYIIVKSDIDNESSQLLAQKYGVRGVPTLLLLDGTGKEIVRSGFMSSPETLKFLRSTGTKKPLP